MSFPGAAVRCAPEGRNEPPAVFQATTKVAPYKNG